MRTRAESILPVNSTLLETVKKAFLYELQSLRASKYDDGAISMKSIQTYLSKLLRNHFFLVGLLLFVFFVCRVYLSQFGYHVDAIIQLEWGRWIFLHSAQGFYTHNVWTHSWPNHPPLTTLLYDFVLFSYDKLLEFFRYASSYIVPHLAPGHMIWWFDFVKWFDIAKIPETDLSIGTLMTLKFFPILADICIALAIYLIAKRYQPKKALLFTGLYLAIPYTWYLSSFWGQTDGVSFLLILISFLLVAFRYLYIAPILLCLAIGLKPTAIFALPIFMFIYVEQKPALSAIIFSLATGLILTILSILPFADRNVYLYTKDIIIQKVIFRSEVRLSTHSYNFWHIFIGNRALSDQVTFLLIKARILGILAIVLVNALAIKLVRHSLSLKNSMVALFIVTAGTWLFATNMLERYYFAGVTSLLLVCIWYPKYLKYWFIISIIYTLNLFDGWWFPINGGLLVDGLLWQDGFITRLLALVNVAVYLRIAWLLVSENLTLPKVAPFTKLAQVKITTGKSSSRIGKKIS